MYDYSVQQCELIKFDEMSVDNYGNYGGAKVLYPESPHRFLHLLLPATHSADAGIIHLLESPTYSADAVY